MESKDTDPDSTVDETLDAIIDLCDSPKEYVDEGREAEASCSSPRDDVVRSSSPRREGDRGSRSHRRGSGRERLSSSRDVVTGAVKKDSSHTPRAYRPGSSRSSAHPKESVIDFKRRMREKQKTPSVRMDILKDEYENATKSANIVRKRTGIVFETASAKHQCDWDLGYPENYKRYTECINRLNELGLITRCKHIKTERFSKEHILRVHTEEHIKLMEDISGREDERYREAMSSKYDAIYFSTATYYSAMTACYSTLSLVKAIIEGEIQNGIAVVRPPGHHAQRENYNGYCFINNVAVAASYLEKEKLKKVLIIDFDVHHGQGTQQIFYDNKYVLYFSIHRYEHGNFWPNLRESQFDYIGEKDGLGYNINVPLNKTNLSDKEYMAIVLNILLPVAIEFQPDIILYSAGYDACIGCPEGEMMVTPGFYGHLIKLLAGLAEGKMAVVLEGGYFLESLCEGVAMTTSALLDDQPAVLASVTDIDESVIETINNVKYVLRPYWKCFQTLQLYHPMETKEEIHKVICKYDGIALPPPYPTRHCYPIQRDTAKFEKLVKDLREEYGSPIANSVCYGYSNDMLKHAPQLESHGKIENPERLVQVHRRFVELQLDKRCTRVEFKKEVEPPILAVHVCSYYIPLTDYQYFSLCQEGNDMYWGKGSLEAVKHAIRAILGCVDSVWNKRHSAGAALIRPPGHHAEEKEYLGFCFINNVAVAAQYLIEHYKAERILILDFDIHHGNGTQNLFYKTSKVLYMSIHKYEKGQYFPHKVSANYDYVGEGEGLGYNINIPFNTGRMGNTEYMYAFTKVVLPVAYSYAPQIVLISAGFDAGINDLLGNYQVLPECFGHMVQLLRPLAGGRIVLAMEGGYNVNTLKHSMAYCVKTLLGDPLPKLTNLMEVNSAAVTSINDVIKVHQQYWPILKLDRPLPAQDARTNPDLHFPN